MPKLTRREWQIVVLIGRGLRGKKIAAALGIAEYTVRTHRAHIIRKLGFSSSAQLAAFAGAAIAADLRPDPVSAGAGSP